jgi:hypothetical protein
MSWHGKDGLSHVENISQLNFGIKFEAAQDVIPPVRGIDLNIGKEARAGGKNRIRSLIEPWDEIVVEYSKIPRNGTPAPIA